MKIVIMERTIRYGNNTKQRIPSLAGVDVKIFRNGKTRSGKVYVVTDCTSHPDLTSAA